jgi:hypothetical protein
MSQTASALGTCALGLYVLVLTQQKADADGQSIYALRPSLLTHSIPQNPLALQEFAQAA